MLREYRYALFDFCQRQSGEIDELKVFGIVDELLSEPAVVKLIFQLIAHKREADGVREQRSSRPYHIGKVN